MHGRCGALRPLFRLVGVRCIAALRRVEKPTASPQQSPVTESLALGRPQIPGQLSASVRPGGSLTEAKCWAVRFPVGRGRPAPTRPSKNQIDCRKVVVGALRVHWPLRHASPNDPPERGCWHIGYFAGMTSCTVVPSVFVSSPCLLASFRSWSMTPARCSCLLRASCAFLCAAKIS
jgi:hypothetical protein